MHILIYLSVLIITFSSVAFAKDTTEKENILIKSNSITVSNRLVKNSRQSINGFDMTMLKDNCYLYPTLTDYEETLTNNCVGSFWIGTYEVTQEQWQKIMGKNPAFFKKCGKKCPIEQVSWDDIQLFLKKLNQMTGKKFRLPTDTEWMYACLGGDSDQKYCGNKLNAETVAWFSDNSNRRTHEVGQKLPNKFGLYDMTGNVWEWVYDRYVDKSDMIDSAANDKGRNKLVKRTYKGGSWADSEWRLRLTFKTGHQADDKSNTLGFRLALEPDVKASK